MFYDGTLIISFERYLIMKIRYSLTWVLVISLFIVSIDSIQEVKFSQLQKQLNLKWSFISQIQHTWFKEIVKKYFTECMEHEQVKALYNCNTTTNEYRQFWKDFLEGLQMIKFRKLAEEGDHSWSQMMTQAANQWITVNKTSSVIQLQDVYDDISKFPSNLMEFAQFTTQHQELFKEMQNSIDWKRSEKPYLTKRNRDQQQMKKDQTEILKKYIDRQCFKLQDAMKECSMPLERYSYYLRDLFFYYFDQPDKYAKYDEKAKMITVKPFLDFKITKLWRDMRRVMKEHLGLGDAVTLEEVEKHSPDILDSVMQSLLRTHGNPSNPANEPKTSQDQKQSQL